MIPDTVAVPSTLWFTPIDQRLSRARLRPQSVASACNCCSSMPQRAHTRSGVQLSSRAASSA